MTINSTGCSDLIGAPDLYIKIKNPTWHANTQHEPGHVANTNAPVTISISPAINLATGSYTIEVFDADNPPVDADDACGVF